MRILLTLVALLPLAAQAADEPVAATGDDGRVPAPRTSSSPPRATGARASMTPGQHLPHRRRRPSPPSAPNIRRMCSTAMPAYTSSAAAARRASAPSVRRCSPAPAPAARSWSPKTACRSGPTGFCNLNEMFELNYEQARQIEVLRGPGSAMFGASAVHGVVNVITPAVHAAARHSSLGVEGGSDSFKRITASAPAHRVPMADCGFGAYGVATRAPGWRDASGVDEAKLNLLGDMRVGGGQLRLRAAGTVLNQETAGFIQGYNSYRDEDIARSNPNPEAFRDASSARVSAQFENRDAFGDDSTARTRRHLPPLAHGFPAALPDRQTARAQRADQLHAERHGGVSCRARPDARVALDAETGRLRAHRVPARRRPPTARRRPTPSAPRAFTTTTRWIPGRVGATLALDYRIDARRSRPPPRCAPTRLTTTTTTT